MRSWSSRPRPAAASASDPGPRLAGRARPARARPRPAGTAGCGTPGWRGCRGSAPPAGRRASGLSRANPAPRGAVAASSPARSREVADAPAGPRADRVELGRPAPGAPAAGQRRRQVAAPGRDHQGGGAGPALDPVPAGGQVAGQLGRQRPLLAPLQHQGDRLALRRPPGGGLAGPGDHDRRPGRRRRAPGPWRPARPAGWPPRPRSGGWAASVNRVAIPRASAVRRSSSSVMSGGYGTLAPTMPLPSSR